MPLQAFRPPRLYFARQRKPEGRPQRAPRRPVSGLLAQKCRLLFSPEYGAFGAFACRVTDVANGGFCVSLIGQRGLPPEFCTGMDVYLEQSDRTLVPAELRWMRGPRIGLKRLPRGWV